MSHFLRTIPILCILSALVMLSACTTAPAPTPGSDLSSTPASTPFNRIDASQLQKGMAVDSVTAALGSPTKIESFEREGKTFEIREYRRRFSQFQGTEATGLERIPYIDPVTGEEREELAPVMQNATVNLVEVTELLLHEGVLLEWKQNLFKLGTSYQ